MKKSFLSIIAVAIILMASIFISQPAEAVTISQLNLEIVARPGETIDEQLVQLYDESFSGATVYPVVYNFTESPEKEGAVLILTDPQDLKPDRSWIQWANVPITAEETEENVDADEVDVEETEEDIDIVYGQEEIPITMPAEGTLVDFPYKIVVPRDAEPGTHLISLVFQLKPSKETDSDGAAVYVGSNVATNIFIKILGATIDDIEVDFQSGVFTNKDPKLSPADKKDFFESKNFFLKPPIDFLITIDNQGNTHQKPDGNIKIINDLWGSRTEEIQVNEVNKIILPGTDRTFEVPSYGTGLMIGKYRAKITLLYGDPLRPVQKEISFWIIPLVEILIILGTIILIIIIIVIIRRMRKGKREAKEKDKEEKMRQQIVDELKGNITESEVVEEKKEKKIKAKSKKNIGNGKNKAKAYNKK
ncbi:MAG: hypothetical protein ACNFW9_04780 [Candidatus Kerfeldbacteria bacterium]